MVQGLEARGNGDLIKDLMGMKGRELVQGEGLKVHKSTHDEFMRGRKLQQVEVGNADSDMQFRKFRPHFDFTQVEKEVAAQWPEISNKVDYMKRVFGTVHDYFHQRMEVLSEPTMNLGGVSKCWDEKIPDHWKNKPLSQDMMIMVVPYNEPTGWFAAAGACLVDSRNNRPVVGMILLNFYHIQPSASNEFYVPLVFIHEFMHVMGFSNNFFDLLGMAENIKIGGKNRYAITSPKVVQHARDYFGCNEVNGVPLENNGGGGSKGSHWEKQIFPNEVMNPMVAYPATISQFTIAAFEDMGFYRGVNAAQRYTYLQGDGCDAIVGHKCPGSPDGEYCRSEDFGHDHCYTNRLGKATCGETNFTGSCGFKSPSHGGLCTLETPNNHINFNFESYGPHSRCVMLSKGNSSFDAGCLRMRCTTDKVEMKIGNEVFTCPSKGRHNVKLQAYEGIIDCPSYGEMCSESLEHRCSMDCSGAGYCMSDRTCQCLHGFLGADCNKGGKQETDPFVTDYEYNPQQPEQPEEPEDENPEEPDEPQGPEEPERPDEPEDSDQVAQIKKDIFENLDMLDEHMIKKFQSNIMKLKMTKYLEVYKKNKWAKNERRVHNKQIRRVHNVEIGKINIKLGKLYDNLDDLLSENQMIDWEVKLNASIDARVTKRATESQHWLYDEISDVDGTKNEFTEYITKIDEELKTEPDPNWIKELQEIKQPLVHRIEYFDKAKMIMETWARELQEQIDGLFGIQGVKKVKAYATQPKGMLKSVKSLLAQEKNDISLQDGLIEQDKHSARRGLI